MIDNIMWAGNEVKHTRLKNKYRIAITTDKGTNQVAAFPTGWRYIGGEQNSQLDIWAM